MVETEFIGCDSFVDALAEGAQSLESPPEWNDFQRYASQLALHYDDAPAKTDRAGYAAIRCSVMEARFGGNWRSLLSPSIRQQEPSRPCGPGGQSRSSRGSRRRRRRRTGARQELQGP